MDGNLTNRTKVFLNLPVFHGVAAQNCSALFCDIAAKFACSNTSVLILTFKIMSNNFQHFWCKTSQLSWRLILTWSLFIESFSLESTGRSQ